MIIPISVLSQAGMRVAFVKLYRRVEDVIEKSIKVHEEEEEEMEVRRKRNNTSMEEEGKREEGVEYDDDEEEENEELSERHRQSASNNNRESTTAVSESALLRLELNDMSCSIAAGVGFGGMHAVLLYGTLLASEGGRLGTLYQPSCSFMPSLINSAFMAFWFSILDVVWMMIAFYGVRVWESHLQYKQSQLLSQQQQHQQGQQTFFTAYNHGAAIMNEWSFAKGRVSGKAALSFMLLSHLCASLTTTMNVIIPVNGCIIALPLLTLVAIGIMVISWIYLKDNFLPESQKQRIRMANHLN